MYINPWPRGAKVPPFSKITKNRRPYKRIINKQTKQNAQTHFRESYGLLMPWAAPRLAAFAKIHSCPLPGLSFSQVSSSLAPGLVAYAPSPTQAVNMSRGVSLKTWARHVSGLQLVSGQAGKLRETKNQIQKRIHKTPKGKGGDTGFNKRLMTPFSRIDTLLLYHRFIGCLSI